MAVSAQRTPSGANRCNSDIERDNLGDQAFAVGRVEKNEVERLFMMQAGEGGFDRRADKDSLCFTCHRFEVCRDDSGGLIPRIDHPCPTGTATEGFERHGPAAGKEVEHGFPSNEPRRARRMLNTASLTRSGVGRMSRPEKVARRFPLAKPLIIRTVSIPISGSDQVSPQQKLTEN